MPPILRDRVSFVAPRGAIPRSIVAWLYRDQNSKRHGLTGVGTCSAATTAPARASK